MLVDGYPIVVDLEKSQESNLRDLVTGKEYLDFFSFFASNPIGFNHPSMREPEALERLYSVAVQKVSNSDYYTTYLAEFADTLSRSAAPPELPHYFFVDGGALAVENAMKVAFDWKVRKNLARGKGQKGSQVLHLERAFHGRSGYTMSVTNTDPVKTDLFPKFPWPRIPSPGIEFPVDAASTARVVEAERVSIAAAERAFEENPDDIAAILVEPIQGKAETITSAGSSSKSSAASRTSAKRCSSTTRCRRVSASPGNGGHYQHFGVVPDVLCFAKKMQVGGIFVSKRVDEVKDNVFHVPSRINSTWGASLVDMVRATHILEIIENENLLENATLRGNELRTGLEAIQNEFDVVTGARGRGLMCAIDLPSTEMRNAVVQRCFEDGMIVLKCGTHSVRFRPTLTVAADAIEEGVRRLRQAIREVIG